MCGSEAWMLRNGLGFFLIYESEGERNHLLCGVRSCPRLHRDEVLASDSDGFPTPPTSE